MAEFLKRPPPPPPLDPPLPPLSPVPLEAPALDLNPPKPAPPPDSSFLGPPPLGLSSLLAGASFLLKLALPKSLESSCGARLSFCSSRGGNYYLILVDLWMKPPSSPYLFSLGGLSTGTCGLAPPLPQLSPSVGSSAGPPPATLSSFSFSLLASSLNLSSSYLLAISLLFSTFLSSDWAWSRIFCLSSSIFSYMNSAFFCSHFSFLTFILAS